MLSLVTAHFLCLDKAKAREMKYDALSYPLISGAAGSHVSLAGTRLAQLRGPFGQARWGPGPPSAHLCGLPGLQRPEAEVHLPVLAEVRRAAGEALGAGLAPRGGVPGEEAPRPEQWREQVVAGLSCAG